MPSLKEKVLTTSTCFSLFKLYKYKHWVNLKHTNGLNENLKYINIAKDHADTGVSFSYVVIFINLKSAKFVIFL